MSLYQRLSISLFIVFVAMLTIIHLWTKELAQRTRYESQQHLHLSLAANLARDNPLLQQGVYDHDALKNLFHTLMVLGPAFEFYFLDPNGNILTHSLPQSYIKRKTIDLLPLIQLTQNRAPLPIYGDDPKHLERKKVFSAAPVFNGAQLQGYLYVIVAGERYDSVHAKNSSVHDNQLSMAVAVAAFAFLFIVMIGIFAYFTRPLRRLNQDIKQLIDNGFDIQALHLQSWPKDSSNEVHQLSEAFHKMAEQINRQLKMLNEIDTRRRELLADISHDLRTPLASLTGYIETLTISQNTTLNEHQQQCLSTALRNAQQLKTMIDQIFELAHLEGGQVSISLETINLAELLFDVVAKFSLSANKKNIAIKIECERHDVLVHTDIAKLERVLSNLLENALRHTDKNGTITIRAVEVDNHSYQLFVEDNGSGIKTEEIAYIFDTRYRASNATESDGKHTGLGLAITKKLLELLQTDIKVQSELGKGSVFSFTVRKANFGKL